jgi:hypothetical protein
MLSWTKISSEKEGCLTDTVSVILELRLTATPDLKCQGCIEPFPGPSVSVHEHVHEYEYVHEYEDVHEYEYKYEAGREPVAIPAGRLRAKRSRHKRCAAWRRTYQGVSPSG